MANELEITTAPEAEELNLTAAPLDEMSFDDDLADIGQQFNEEIEAAEEQLPTNLEGFASRFPEWNLEPPKR